jgi:hypothetical protein
MARCDAAAADGADGSTYAEVIADWRQQIGAHVYHNRRKGCARNRLAAAVDRHFDALEAWHESNGTLHAEIG